MKNDLTLQSAEKGHPSFAPGWFGKLPAMGDFVSRRLDDDFIRRWDEWLAQGVQSIKQSHGEQANEILLTFPIWHFMIPRRLFDEESWIGILLPSVDRVGRCFPLTIAQPLSQVMGQHALLDQTHVAPTLLATHDFLRPWVNAAIDVLDDDDVERFESRLAQSNAAVLSLAALHTPDHASSLQNLLIAIASRLATSQLAGESLWWTGSLDADAVSGSNATPARLLRWPGVPDSKLLVELLSSVA
jgi:type VI secretion system protein ImpM